MEMWPPWSSMVTSRMLADVVEIFEVKMMLLCCLLMLLMKLCKRSMNCDQIIRDQIIVSFLLLCATYIHELKNLRN